jgi:hypothetical protein
MEAKFRHAFWYTSSVLQLNLSKQKSLCKQVFKKNSTSTFILGTSVPLGDLVCLRIWHDNSGDGKLQSWFLHRAVITDLQTNEK